MYTALNWALDLGLYAAVCAITCALWWLSRHAAETVPPSGRAGIDTRYVFVVWVEWVRT